MPSGDCEESVVVVVVTRGRWRGQGRAAKEVGSIALSSEDCRAHDSSNASLVFAKEAKDEVLKHSTAQTEIRALKTTYTHSSGGALCTSTSAPHVLMRWQPPLLSCPGLHLLLASPCRRHAPPDQRQHTRGPVLFSFTGWFVFLLSSLPAVGKAAGGVGSVRQLQWM